MFLQRLIPRNHLSLLRQKNEERTMFCKRILLSLLLNTCILMVVVHTQQSWAELPTPREYDGVEITEHVGEKIPLHLKFKNAKGEDVLLQDYFNQDKPVLLTLVYYNCPMLCNLVLNGVLEGIKELDWLPGESFEMVSVSISPRETPDLAMAKKKNYMQRLAMPGAEKGWHFLTGDATAVKALADAVGFGYRYDPSTQDYAHGAAIFFLNDQGKLTRYLYGAQFEPQQLRLALTESDDIHFGSIINQVLLRCFQYEPSHKKYSFYIWGAIRTGGALTVLGICIFLIILWRGEKRQAISTSQLT